MKILITGATGLIGKEIGRKLFALGHDLTVISRSTQKAKQALPFKCEVIEGDLTHTQLNLPDDFDVCIHLLGESIAKRWTSAAKKQILDSRVVSTQNLLRSFKKAPSVLINASATGFYGDRGEENLDESTGAGTGFLAEVCQAWESSFFSFQKTDLFKSSRFVAVRTGMVLSPQGGALQKMLPIFRMGLGSPLGSGQQWISWIHLEDIADLYVWAALNPKISGVVNGVSPTPVRNYEFSKLLAQSVKRPLLPAVPAFVLKIILGEMSSMLLASTRVHSKLLEREHFQFKFPKLQF